MTDMSWFENRRNRYVIENSQAHADSLNKIQRDHDAEMERMTQASQDRIAAYQQSANDQVAAARQPSFESSVDESPGLEMFEPPGTEDDQMAQELVNRMDEHG